MEDANSSFAASQFSNESSGRPARQRPAKNKNAHVEVGVLQFGGIPPQFGCASKI
jgi:hypothetical protein